MRDEFRLPDDAPGRYMSLREDKEYHKTYYPDPLPPTLDLPEAVVMELARATHALGRLDGVGSEVDKPGTVFSAFVYKEAEQSSQIEGTRVTVSDIRKLEIGEFSGTKRDAPEEKNVREARNYLRALQEGLDFIRMAGRDRENISLNFIKSMHGTLMEDGRTDKEDPRPGEFRSGPAYITEGVEGVESVRFAPPTADMAAGRMDDFERYVQSSGRYPDLVDIALIHYQFETIHPFVDGNGRIGRLLIVLLLYVCDLLVTPMLYPSAYLGRHRNEYTDRLLAVSEEGKWTEWLAFFLSAIRRQAEEAFVRAKLLLGLRRDYGERYADGTPSVSRLANEVFAAPYLTVNEAAERINMSYGAANDAVDVLVADGVLQQDSEGSRNRVFEAGEIMDVVERPPAELPDPTDLILRETQWDITVR
jgi:Fic family protein